MRVLYSCPSAEEESAWLPYAWGKFREYASRYDKFDLSSVIWMNPIYLGYFDVSKLIIGIDFKKVDVLLLTMYVWNEDRQLEIAGIAKSVNPNIVILAGGPQAKYKPHHELERYKSIDYVTPYEGEEVVAESLGRLINGISLDDYELLVSPSLPIKYVKPQRLDLSKARSPYVLYKNSFRLMSDKARKLGMSTYSPLETNRGCPYKCTFCDWGSATADKIRRYTYDTVISEIKAMGDLALSFVFISDANFGIFDVDLEYTKALVESKIKTGSPAAAMFLSAKNKKSISNEAHKILFKSKMMIGAEVGFQHTDEDVLAAIIRSNIKMQKMKEEISEMVSSGIPVAGTLILGNPGDTPEKWKSAIDDMLNIGFHEDLKIFDFMLLPNAPASDPVYIDRYKIKSMKKYGQTELKIAPGGKQSQPTWLADFICATDTFSEDDYVYMQAYAAFVNGQHIMNVTRFIAIYLKEYHEIPYKKFYDTYSQTGRGQKIFEELIENYAEYVKNDKLGKHMKIGESLVDPYLYNKVQSLIHRDELFDDVKKIILGLVPELEEGYVDDLISTQRATITSWEPPESVYVEHDFIKAFKKFVKIDPLIPFEKTPIEKIDKIKLQSKDERVGLMNAYDLKYVKKMSDWLKHFSVNTNHLGGGGYYYISLLKD